ncbi:DUF1501 domain-containing protein [Sphingobium sp. Sx8-8]|uniref:DUF1501 domain-containing protein n=1 Tax=Sphingobium sp. Sx8-8 TaxID=2933617 RepID=UPI001F57E0A3|nr:DUF1501 domain-containing protein [Sphingobium sp. Sx8-8]
MDRTPVARRRFLTLSAAGAGSLLVAPHMAFATVPTDRRFVFIIQRGAADGLNIVVPYADPGYARLRGALAIDPAAAIKLDGQFALHPALVRLGEMYRENQALFVHAVASPYRDRSHFDGQNMLETGGLQPYAVRDGWMNRLVGLMPHAGDQAIALAATVPPALRGPVSVESYMPSALPAPSDDLIERVGTLYAADSQLHPLWAAALDAKAAADRSATKSDPAGLGHLAAAFLTKPEGPRIAMLETSGWDTHTAQEGRLASQLKGLDLLLAALKEGMGAAWASTTVLIATEFGRTAAANGTGGTDHGTGAVAMLVGGAVRGGRIVAEWPGLAPSQLYESRDLRPTLELDSLIAGTAAASLGLDPEQVSRTLFRDRVVRPLTGLVA